MSSTVWAAYPSQPVCRPSTRGYGFLDELVLNIVWEVTVHVDKVINVVGKACPMPLIALAKEVRNLRQGQTVQITGNDPLFEESIAAIYRLHHPGVCSVLLLIDDIYFQTTLFVLRDEYSFSIYDYLEGLRVFDVHCRIRLYCRSSRLDFLCQSPTSGFDTEGNLIHHSLELSIDFSLVAAGK